MEKWECTICGYIYDEQNGDPENSVPPGTRFAELPKDWVCPLCGAGQDMFEKIS
jgi:rubredoxin